MGQIKENGGPVVLGRFCDDQMLLLLFVFICYCCCWLLIVGTSLLLVIVLVVAIILVVQWLSKEMPWQGSNCKVGLQIEVMPRVMFSGMADPCWDAHP